MRYRLFTILLLRALSAFADEGVRDSVQVQEVEISASRLSHFSVTDRVEQVDTLMIQRYVTQDLGALLQRTSLINIQSNGGVGALTTASLRGASSDHTLVTWNGIPVNSLTTGAADLSTINVSGFNSIQITYGAAGTLYGSGTMGGVIDLSNEPIWNKGMSLSARAELGSFSNYKGNLQLGASNDKLSYQGQVLYHEGKNDFTYTDVFDHGHPTETLTHNESSMVGTIHQLTWRAGHNLFDAGAWYQVKDKNIPGLMGVGLPVSHQTQKDSTLKVYAGWKRLFGNWRIEAKTAYSSDFLRYTDKLSADSESYKIYSEIAAKRSLSDFSTRWYVSQDMSIDLNGRYSYLKGITSNYANDIIEHEGRLNAAFKYSPQYGVFIAMIGKDWCVSESNEVKIPIYENDEIIDYTTVEHTLPNPPVMFSFSAKISVLPKWLAVRGKASTHFRRPTFNDRYWVPGGNLLLKPEKGYNFEIGAEVFEQKTSVGYFAFDMAFYRANNDESIAWKPTNGAIWQPINTGAVVSQGIDTELNHRLLIGNYSVNNKVLYGFNNSYDNSKQSDKYKEVLGYRPKHIFKMSSDIIAQKWNAGVMFYSRSKCYTWEGRVVDGYALFDVNAGYKIATSPLKLELMARVENVFDTSYQLVRAYPMPGRAYYLSVNINF